MKRPAVFFDRDNTLIVSDGYLGDPSKVVLVEGAADIVGRVRSLGYAVVVFSNQSGVARGMFTEDDVHRVNAKLDELLADHNPQAVIDRHEFCPFHPDGTVAEYARESELRKPQAGMILQAAGKLALDLQRSWVIGDAPRDIEAGRAAGCRTIWFKDPKLPPSSSARELMLTVPDAVVSSLREAIDVIAREALVRQASAPGVSAARPEAEMEAQTDPDPRPEAALETADPVKSPTSPALAPWTRRSTTGGPKSVASAKPLMQMLAQKRAAAAAASVGNTDPQPAADAPADAPIPSTARLEELAEQILQELQRRKDIHEADFSVSKLLAGIVQIVALAVLVLSYFLYRHDPLPAILTAIFLESFTIALLIMGRQH
jgi:D-glycero-D-manno-heptose 1,7-bisphosphate phosphatase